MEKYSPCEYHNHFDDKNLEAASVCGKISVLGDVDCIILNLWVSEKITFDAANELRNEIYKLNTLYLERFNELVGHKTIAIEGENNANVATN